MACFIPSWTSLGQSLVQVGRYSGMTGQVEQMAALLPAQAIVITSRRGMYVDLIMPLKLVGGVEVAFHQEPLGDQERGVWTDCLRRWQNSGHRLVYLDFGTQPIPIAPEAQITDTARGDLVYSVMPYNPDRLDLTPISQRRRSYALRSFSVK